MGIESGNNVPQDGEYTSSTADALKGVQSGQEEDIWGDRAEVEGRARRLEEKSRGYIENWKIGRAAKKAQRAQRQADEAARPAREAAANANQDVWQDSASQPQAPELSHTPEADSEAFWDEKL